MRLFGGRRKAELEAELQFVESKLENVTASVFEKMNYVSRKSSIATELALLGDQPTSPALDILFEGGANVGSDAIEAQFVADTLRQMLLTLKTEYSAKSLNEPLGERGRIKHQRDMDLLITGIKRGSFGFELTAPDATDLFSHERVSEVLATFLDELHHLGSTDQAFLEAISRFENRSVRHLAQLFKTLASRQSGIKLSTFEKTLELNLDDVTTIDFRFGHIEPSSVETEVYGKFLGVLAGTYKFEYELDNGQLVSGRVDEAIEEDKLQEWTDAYYNSWVTLLIRTDRITHSSGQVSEKVTLLNLK